MRTYIFTYAETYNSLSLERLAQMFELPLQLVHSIVSKMIFKEEFLVRVNFMGDIMKAGGWGVVVVYT